MTIEDHVKALIGQLVLQIAQLSAQVDDLRAQLAAKDTPRD